MRLTTLSLQGPLSNAGQKLITLDCCFSISSSSIPATQSQVLECDQGVCDLRMSLFTQDTGHSRVLVGMSIVPSGKSIRDIVLSGSQRHLNVGTNIVWDDKA